MRSKSSLLSRLFLARLTGLLLFSLVCARGQPVITSVHSAATNLAPAAPAGLTPQMLVAIVGQDLTTGGAATASYPWPPQLGGSTVTFNGTAAALAYVSSTQINAVVPSALNTATSASVVVTTPAGASAAVTVPLMGSSLGIFTQDMSGCGKAVALNVHADGSVSMNSPQNSLDPQKDWGLTLFLTGAGAFADRTDGLPWQFNPADNRAPGGAVDGVNAFFGMPNVGMFAPPLTVRYAGPMPLQAGVDQANVALSTNAKPKAPEGCRVPLYLSDSSSASQIVNVSIHSGGGTCSDAPSTSLGLVNWQQSVVSDASGTSSSSSVSLQFLQGPGLGFVQPPTLSSGGPAIFQPAFCAAAYPATLGAGTVTISGGGLGPLSIQPQTQFGIVSYQAPLPSAPGGTYSLSAAGSSAGVGAFSATSSIPPPITITNTNLAPGTLVSASLQAPFTLHWTGGDARSVITVQYINLTTPGQRGPYPGQAVLAGNASGSDGTVTLSQIVTGLFGPPEPALPGPTAEIVVTQQPATALSQSFSAPSLSLGGEQTWKYVWDFRGLLNQPSP